MKRDMLCGIGDGIGNDGKVLADLDHLYVARAGGIGRRLFPA
jgi:hypothetical protein